MSICDQVHHQKFWHTWRTWKIIKKTWIQIYQFWNLYCNTVERFVRPKICKIFKFCMNELCKLPLKKNSVRQTFVNTKILFLSLLTINCGFQHDYLTSCITLSGKKSSILFIKISWIQKIWYGKKNNLTINAFLWKKWLLEKEKEIS